MPNRAFLIHFPTSGSNIEGGLFDISSLSALIGLKPKFRTQNTTHLQNLMLEIMTIKTKFDQKNLPCQFFSEVHNLGNTHVYQNHVEPLKTCAHRVLGGWVELGVAVPGFSGFSFSIYLKKIERFKLGQYDLHPQKLT